MSGHFGRGQARSAMMARVGDDDLSEWQFEVRERSAGVYEGTGTHFNGASVRAVGPDPDDLLKRLRQEARELLA